MTRDDARALVAVLRARGVGFCYGRITYRDGGPPTADLVQLDDESAVDIIRRATMRADEDSEPNDQNKDGNLASHDVPHVLDAEGRRREAADAEKRAMDIANYRSRRTCSCPPGKHPPVRNMLEGGAERDGRICELGWPK